MRLRNKKTGEIVETDYMFEVSVPTARTFGCKSYDQIATYNSLAELNEEWEDYEEPKTFWAISWAGEPEEYDAKNTPEELKNMAKQIGNYFDTREEAEKAVERLRALKRLKDKGFRFDGKEVLSEGLLEIDGILSALEGIDNAERLKIIDDLDLLFSWGEE